MRCVVALSAALAVAAACSDSGGVDPDAIDDEELSAVQYALGTALANEAFYSNLALLVFPFVDRASRVPNPSGDTTRLVGIEMDLDITTDSAVVAQLTTVLAWRGYDRATKTVDSVFLVVGAGLTPVDDSLTESFSPDTAGTGTAIVTHEARDSMITVWQTGRGRLITTASAYARGRVLTASGLTFTVFRGTLSGSYDVAVAHQVPDSATDVGATQDFSGGARAVKVVIRGTL